MMRITSVIALVAAIALACTPPSTTGGAKNANVLTREEIAASHVYNAYDAVATLRPAFFHSHGPTTLQPGDTGQPKVYLNHMLFGDIESLRSLDVSGIREIHFYSASEASNRFGLGNVSGAIEVITDAR
jgi:hypothetical protein